MSIWVKLITNKEGDEQTNAIEQNVKGMAYSIIENLTVLQIFWFFLEPQKTIGAIYIIDREYFRK